MGRVQLLLGNGALVIFSLFILAVLVNAGHYSNPVTGLVSLSEESTALSLLLRWWGEGEAAQRVLFTVAFIFRIEAAVWYGVIACSLYTVLFVPQQQRRPVYLLWAVVLSLIWCVHANHKGLFGQKHAFTRDSWLTDFLLYWDSPFLVVFWLLFAFPGAAEEKVKKK